MRKKYGFEINPSYTTGKLEYIVRFLSYPNVIGSGETIEEAIKEAEGNLEFYLEYLEDKNRPTLENIYKRYPAIRNFEELNQVIQKGLYYNDLEAMCDLMCPPVEKDEDDEDYD